MPLAPLFGTSAPEVRFFIKVKLTATFMRYESTPIFYYSLAVLTNIIHIPSNLISSRRGQLD
jgi:hypothetical protein